MNSRKAVQRAVIAIATLAAAVAWGHPNHAEPGTQTTVLHLLTEPDHLLALLAAVAVGIGAFGGLRRRSERKPRRD